MLKQLTRFEWFYQIKQPSFIILLLTSLAYGIAINVDVMGQGMELLDINSPYRLSYFIALTSVLSILVAMMFCVNSLLRDKEFQFEGIIGTLAIKPRLMSRALVILLSTLCITSILSVGLMLGMLSPDHPVDKVAEFSLSFYLWPWLVFVLPNAVIGTCILIAVTMKIQTAAATYITALLLFILFWLAMMFIGAPLTGNPVIKDPAVVSFFALIDPFGTSAFFEQSQFWTPQQKNQQLFSLSGSLLFNRILWLLISLGLIVYVQRLFSQHSLPETKQSVKRSTSLYTYAETKAESKTESKTAKRSITNDKQTMPSVNPMKATLMFQITAWLTLSKFEIKQLLSQTSFRVLMMIPAGMSVIGMLMATGVFSSNEFSGRYPTTSLLISYSTEAFTAIVTALIIFFSAEKIWQHKLLKADSLVDCTPVANVSIYGAKLISLFFIPLSLMAVNIVTSIILQVASEYYRFDMAHFLSQFYYTAAQVLLNTVLIFFIQARIASSRFANKYLGMVVSALVVIFISNSSGLFGFEHPLLSFNQLPSLLRVYSELAGYGSYGSQFNYLAAFWTVFALILAGLTVTNWNRGEWHKSKNNRGGKTATSKQAVSNQRITRGYFGISIVALLSIGISINYSMPASNDYQTVQQSFDNQEYYERQYQQYQNLAIPQISHMKMAVDIFPNKQSYSVNASYQLTNTGNEAIHEIFVTSRLPLQAIEITGATVSLTDSTSDWHVYLFQLTQPLLPGQNIAMSYQLQQTSSAFAINNSIVANGTYLTQAGFEPFMGYVAMMEMNDKYERSNRNLPTKDKDFSGYGKFVTQKRSFEAVLSTSLEQTAVTSGRLINNWQQDGRNYFHYKMQQPIYPLVGYFSSVYQTKTISHQGINIEMYYHPAHHQNIDEMLRATKATLDYSIENFGAYAFDSLRILEVPKYHPFGGKAASGMVALSERLYEQDYNGGAAINNVARNTIHEVLHQWWGEKLVPKITAGEGMLVESITKYGEAVILGKMYGKSMSRSLIKYSQRRYFSGRAYAYLPEVGLAAVEKAAYLSYGKGPVVFSALRELLGEQRVNAVLKQFIARHQHKLSATTDDLLNSLYAISNEQQKRLIQDWLTKVIDYDLVIDNAVVNKLPPSQNKKGQYEVIIDVTTLRFATDKEGLVNQIDIDEPITIALYSGHPDNKNSKAIYFASQQVNSEKSTITLIVTELPGYVVIDPNYTRLDKDLSNNIAKFGAN